VTEYLPLLSAVAVLVPMVILAPGTTAPLSSATWPFSVAFCAKPAAAASREIRMSLCICDINKGKFASVNNEATRSESLSYRQESEILIASTLYLHGGERGIRSLAHLVRLCSHSLTAIENEFS